MNFSCKRFSYKVITTIVNFYPKKKKTTRVKQLVDNDLEIYVFELSWTENANCQSKMQKRKPSKL